MSRAKLVSRDGYRHEIKLSSGHTVVFDEPETVGGNNLGPTPTDMLAASLAACTAMTLKMYATRKEWSLEGLDVEVEKVPGDGSPASYRVDLTLPEHLDADQQRRLRVIATKCPVHRTLAEAVRVEVV